MAYMNQEKKAALAPAIKSVLKKYGIKGTLGVRHHSTLSIKLQHNPSVIPAECLGRGINPYWFQEHYKNNPVFVAFLNDLFDAANGRTAGASITNHDNSDSMTDYFDVGWYIDVDIVHAKGV